MKRVLLTLLLILALVGCGAKEEKAVVKEEKIGLVLSIGGLGDKSFNDSAYEGILKVKEETGIEIKYVEPETVAVMSDYLNEFADGGYDLVITVGFYFADPLKEVAAAYPETKFVIIDGVVDEANVKSVVFDERQRGILAGATAALKSETGVLGMVGGLEIPLIKTYIDGFVEGAELINPNVEVLVNYAGTFTDPVKGKEIAISLNNAGADVINHAAGGTGTGVMEAAKELGFYAIGTDSDQKYLAPEYVISSVLKKIDNVVLKVSQDFLNGEFTGGIEALGLKEDGIGLTDKVEGVEVVENKMLEGQL